MFRDSKLRRSLALFLLGGVVAASSGFAIHDPDCLHHRGAEHAFDGEGIQHSAAHGHAAHGAEHSGHSERVPYEDCSCLGFCACVADVGVVLPDTEGSDESPDALEFAAMESPERTPLPAAPRFTRPPATGPPFLT